MGLDRIGDHAERPALAIHELHLHAVALMEQAGDLDAPLAAAEPIDESRCGACSACTEACPAGAVSGRFWQVGLERDAFFNAAACRKTARERAVQGFGVELTICGKCIEVCPYTRGYLNRVD